MEVSSLRVPSTDNHHSIADLFHHGAPIVGAKPCENRNPSVYDSFLMRHEFCGHRNSLSKVVLQSWDATSRTLVPMKLSRTEVHIDMVTLDTKYENGNHMGILTGNRMEYAMHHYYNYYFASTILPGAKHLAPHFSKLAAIELLLNDDLAEKQWIVWTDSDVFVTNFSKKFETIIEQYAHAETDMIIARDLKHDWTLLNTGVFMLRNSEWTRNFLSSILNSDAAVKKTSKLNSKTKSSFLVDQDVIINHLLAQGEIHHSEDGRVEINEHVSVIPTRTMNSFCRPYGVYLDWDKGYDGTWEQGDFMAHFTGTKNDRERHDALTGLREMVVLADGSYQDPLLSVVKQNPCKIPLTGITAKYT